jgi:hypothetical protein
VDEPENTDKSKSGHDTISHSQDLHLGGGNPMPAQVCVSRWLESFQDYPPRQKPGSFSLDQVMDQLTTAASN